MALAAAARELKDAREAVPSKKMTSKEAAADIEGFWKTQPLEAVHVEASSLKAHRGGHAAHEDARSANKASTLKGSANKTANKAANMGSTIKGAAAQPAGVGHAPVAAKAPHGETAAKAPGGEAVVNEAASHGGVETARGGKGGAGEQEKGAAGDGADAEAKGGGGDWADGAASGSKRRAEDMGLPSGRKAAVDTPTGMSAEAAHSSIDDYFGQLVKTSRDNDTFDIKTRVALKARALKRAQVRPPSRKTLSRSFRMAPCCVVTIAENPLMLPTVAAADALAHRPPRPNLDL
ncbi:hypothetical protein T484DRAFT_3479716 [Baffinella frigidus]|nr:hypothetical protein T484DRAFT_3479716 [Cryptophyta sp. CCMP2293]